MTSVESKVSIVAGLVPAVPLSRPFEYLPISFFGAVMGLAGLSGSWRIAETLYALPEVVSMALGLLAMLAFVLLTSGYAIKMAYAPEVVRAEFTHPVVGNLFATFLISLLLLPMVSAPFSLVLARILWVAGAVGMLAFAWFIVHRWMTERQQIAHCTPHWILPVVGMLNVPLAVPFLALPAVQPAMLFWFAVGLIFLIPLFTLIFSRLVFEPALPEALQPTLMILPAPFAVAASSYIATTGRTDIFAASLFAFSVFIMSVLVGRLGALARSCPFRVTWWSVSFPLAAAATAALRLAEASSGRAMNAVALVLLAFASVVVLALLIQTIVGIARGELRALSA